MKSDVRAVGAIRFPEFSGQRVMMMPFHVHDARGTLPESLAGYREPIAALVAAVGGAKGTGYVTVDEALVRAGETHRRPGLHVDGVGPDGRAGAWGGGGGGGWAKRGMVVASSHFGCIGWNQTIGGIPGPDGDCEHLRAALLPEAAVPMRGGVAYWCGPLAVHESVPMASDTRRQFLRVSLPSDAPWYEGYTPNPLGIAPAGPVHPRRVAQMGFR